MTTEWLPLPGMVALLEPRTAGREHDLLTGVVLPDASRLLIDLGASPGVNGAEAVLASFFAADALYKLDATALPTGSGTVVELEVHEIERIQRRAEPRTRVRLPVPVAGGDSMRLAAETVDVAGSGCRIATEKPLPAGADATLVIRVPGMEEPIVVEARVLEVAAVDDHFEERLTFAAIGAADQALLRAVTAV